MMDAGITVTGVGLATAPPNVFRLDLGAQVVAESATAALRGAGQALDRMRSVLITGGVAREDLASGAINLWPEHGDQGRAISGYTATLRLTARIRDLDKAGMLLAETVAAGGDASRLEGATFEYADPAALLNGAREAAWRDAEDKAAKYAALSGRSLGRIVAISEQVHGGGPSPMPRVMSVATAETVPVEPGTSSVTVQVDARWEFA
jgi:uncharacterized protein